MTPNDTVPLVRDYMNAPVRTIGAAASLDDAWRVLEEADVSALAVVGENRGEPVGVISRSDLLRVAGQRPSQRGRAIELPDSEVVDIMWPELVAVGPWDELSRAAHTMVNRRIHRLFAAEGDELLGVVSAYDLMQATADSRIRRPLGDLMSEPLVSVDSTATVGEAMERMEAGAVHTVVVVEEGWPIGVFSQADALAAVDASPDTPVEDVMDVAVLCLPTTVAIHRAAAHALAMDVGVVFAIDDSGVRGLVTDLDFVRGFAEWGPTRQE